MKDKPSYHKLGSESTKNRERPDKVIVRFARLFRKGTSEDALGSIGTFGLLGLDSDSRSNRVATSWDRSARKKIPITPKNREVKTGTNWEQIDQKGYLFPRKPSSKMHQKLLQRHRLGWSSYSHFLEGKFQSWKPEASIQWKGHLTVGKMETYIT